MPEDLKVSQIGSSPLPPPFRGLHSPGVRKHCQIIFACYFRKSSIADWAFPKARTFHMSPDHCVHWSDPFLPLEIRKKKPHRHPDKSEHYHCVCFLRVGPSLRGKSSTTTNLPHGDGSHHCHRIEQKCHFPKIPIIYRFCSQLSVSDSYHLLALKHDPNKSLTSLLLMIKITSSSSSSSSSSFALASSV